MSTENQVCLLLSLDSLSFFLLFHTFFYYSASPSFPTGGSQQRWRTRVRELRLHPFWNGMKMGKLKKFLIFRYILERGLLLLPCQIWWNYHQIHTEKPVVEIFRFNISKYLPVRFWFWSTSGRRTYFIFFFVYFSTSTQTSTEKISFFSSPQNFFLFNVACALVERKLNFKDRRRIFWVEWRCVAGELVCKVEVLRHSQVVVFLFWEFHKFSLAKTDVP